TSSGVRFSLAAWANTAGANSAMPGNLSQRSFCTRRSRLSSSRFIVVLGVVDGRLAGVTRHRRRDELVVDREVGVTERQGVENRVPETQGCRRRDEALLVAQDVLDVFGADVAGGHDFGDGVTGRGLTEELDEKDEPLDFALNGALASSEGFEVSDAGVAQADET